MIRIPLFFFLLLSIGASAQFRYVLDQSIPVQKADGSPLTMAWAGGLNATQYNSLDLNHDSQNDLVLFDRMANKVIPFLRQDTQYKYAPEYEAFFPGNVLNWMLLRDFNCDGKKDLFTGDNAGIRVFKNVTETNGHPSWEHVLFYTGFSGPKSEALLTKGFSSKINLQLQFDDLPSIEDADGDGDLDIFCMQLFGDGSVEFHQNFSQERYGRCDSLDFERITRTWGGVKECRCGEFALNGDACSSGGRTKHAGGKSLLAMDVNHDQKTDLLLSEASCGYLFQLPNDGTLLNPIINTYSVFPPVNPGTNLILYPAPYYEDLDADGAKDLLVSSNIFSKPPGVLNLNLAHSNRFYRNTGSTAAPVFEFIQDDFLQANMIDVGDNAVPAFADFDGDGDDDLLISRHSSPDFSSTIVLYENIGSNVAPAFKLNTEDYMQFSLTNFYNLKVQIADMDGNNTRDLVFTATDLSTGLTGLYYVANKSRTALDVSSQAITPIEFAMSFNENVHVTDVNADGKVDLLAGRSNGAVEYWKNTNQGTAPSFALEDESFIGLGASIFRNFPACTVSDLDADGKDDLVYGDQTGVLKIIADYRNTADDSEPKKEIVFNPLQGEYGAMNLGGRIWPTTTKIFNTANPSVVVGNTLGGIHLLKNENIFSIYPNPVSRHELLQIEVDKPTVLYIYSITGARSAEPITLSENDSLSLKLPPLAQGLYVFRFVSARKTFSKKILIK